MQAKYRQIAHLNITKTRSFAKKTLYVMNDLVTVAQNLEIFSIRLLCFSVTLSLVYIYICESVSVSVADRQQKTITIRPPQVCTPSSRENVHGLERELNRDTFSILNAIAIRYPNCSLFIMNQ